MTDQTPRPHPRLLSRVTSALAGAILTQADADAIAALAQSRVGVEKPAPLTPVEQTTGKLNLRHNLFDEGTHEHVESINCPCKPSVILADGSITHPEG